MHRAQRFCLAASHCIGILLLAAAALGQPLGSSDAAGPRPGSLDPTVSGESPSREDGGYGRFAGDLDLGLALGAELGPETRRPGARLSLHYFSMAGLVVGYTDALGSESRAERTLTLGVDLRPLFVPRWSNDLTRGPAMLDLTLDSLSLGAGAFWSQPPGRGLGVERGFEGSVGIGVPLLGRAGGPWLEGRALARWSATESDLSPRAAGAGLILLAWHQLVETRLVRRRR